MSSLEHLSPDQKRALLARLKQKQGAIKKVPLSPIQDRLWFLHQLDPSAAINVMAPAIRFQGTLDHERLTHSFNQVIARHEVLRTTFNAGPEGVRQVIHPELRIEIPTEDLAALPQAEREQRVNQRHREEHGIPFDLEQGPLIRVRLLRLSEREHVMLLLTHHIISDGFSHNVLVDELSRIYSGDGDLEPLPLQYADFAKWQTEWLESEELAKQLSWWHDRLHGAATGLELQPFKALSRDVAARLATVEARFEPEFYAAIEKACAAARVTPYMFLLTAFNVLLFRYTGQRDLSVGTPVAGRNRPGLDRLVGAFINTLVLRTQLRGEMSFTEILSAVRDTVVESFSRQDVPFSRLVEELQPDRGANRNPLFSVVFSLQSTALGHDFSFGDMTWSYAHPPIEANLTDMVHFSLTPKEDGLHCLMAFQAAIFDEPDALRMLAHYRQLLGSVLADPDQSIALLDLLTEEERTNLRDVPKKESAPSSSLHQWFEAQAKQRPEAIALSLAGATCSFGTLNARANQMAAVLIEQGVRLGDRVAILLPRSFEQMTAIFAVLKAGAAYVPLGTDWPLERLNEMLADAGVRALVTGAEYRDTVNLSREIACLAIDQIDLSTRPDTNPNLPTYFDQPAYIIYTSGSTGKPKGVQMSHGAVIRLLTATQAEFRFSENDVWTGFHAYTFDFSVWEIFGALLYGGRLIIVPREKAVDSDAMLTLLAEEGVTVLNQTPSAFRHLIWSAEESEQLPKLSLRYVIFGGEALDLAMLGPWLELYPDCHLINMYGITETCVHVTLREIVKADTINPIGSLIGGAMEDLSMQIVDTYLQLQPIGVTGELVVGGPGLAHGYLDRPALTALRFVPDPYSDKPGARSYRSGDLARHLPGGEIQYLGRSDFQVKIRGYRIELGEIESVLTRQPEIRAAVVLARTVGDETEARLVAYVVAEALADDLKERLRAHLPEYMVPTHFITLDALPLNANGKVDRVKLPAPGAAEVGSAEYVPPETELEEQLAEIWREMLGLERVSVMDDFFDLGGHSLLATQVIHRINGQLSLSLTVRDLFEEPTVAGMALHIEEILLDELDGLDEDED